MTTPNSMATLYGSSLSLYTGRARSYLIKAGIPYSEKLPLSRHYEEAVLPRMGGRKSIPVLETENGEVIRDGAAIIDHYENRNGNAFSPVTPKLKFLSLLFDVIGTEGLLRPAMHYRWNFPEENLDFLRFHFECFVPKNLAAREMADKQMNRMRNAGRSFGAVEDTFDFIETHYTNFLTVLDAHFENSPYLLGDKPSIGDFGMIAPLFGHLGRDPKPLRLMQCHAPRVFRWVERMNRPEPDSGEFDSGANDYFMHDEVPQTLVEVLKYLAIDFVPETKAACACINQWLTEQQDLSEDSVAERAVGNCNFKVQDTAITAIAQPYRFYLLARAQDFFDSLHEKDSNSVQELLRACDLDEVLTTKLSRKIGRKDNREVWL